MKNICNLYIGAWCLYYLQGTLYESGQWLSQGLMLVLILSSLYYFYYANKRYKLPNVLKILNIMLIIFTLYGSFIMLFGNGVSYVADYQYLKAIYMSLLPVYSFYVFTMKGELTEKTLKLWVLFFIPIAIASYFRDQREALLAAMEIRSSREEFTLNSAYIFLAIIPAIALYKKALFQYSLLAICSYFVLTGMKRGAMLIGALCLLYFIMSSFKHKSNTKKIWIFLLSVGLLALVYYGFLYMLNTSDYFNARLEQTREGNASGRDVLFSVFWNYFLDSNIFFFLFGSGADATLRIIGYAHNDWLEIAVNNGVFGIVLYITYWINLYKTSNNTKDDALKKIIMLFFIVYFFKTFFSMSYNDIPIYATCALGYALAQQKMGNLKQINIRR